MIVTPAVKAYLERLHTPGDEDPLLREMRAHGERDGIPIVHAETGAFLELIVRATGARAVVEVGTAIGVSTLHLARAGAHVTSFEIDAERHAAATDYLARDGRQADLRLQDADEGLAALAPETFDLGFIDGPKDRYGAHLERILELLRPGGVLLVDNALMSGSVATGEPAGPWNQEQTDRQISVNERIAAHGGTVLPVGDGVAFLVRG